MSKQERPAQESIEIRSFSELAYARDLFVHLFRDGTPFVNLGYGSAQVQTALTAIRQLENEKGFVFSQDLVNFQDDDNYYRSTIATLKNGGWKLLATRNVLKQIKDASTESEDSHMIFVKYITHRPRVPFFKNEGVDMMVIVSMLPNKLDWSDISQLVPSLYESWEWTTQERRMVTDTPLARVKQTALGGFESTYKAAWIDDETKLDLVVLHGDKHVRFMAKKGLYGEEGQEGKLDVWRRLPEQELDGKTWIPFGRKLNVSSEQAMAAFERQQNVISGQLTLAPQELGTQQ